MDPSIGRPVWQRRPRDWPRNGQIEGSSPLVQLSSEAFPAQVVGPEHTHAVALVGGEVFDQGQVHAAGRDVAEPVDLGE
jgi:hypothetical protein